MAAIEKKPIKITETVLRDAHQSLIATRLTTEQMLPIVDKMDKVGYHSTRYLVQKSLDINTKVLRIVQSALKRIITDWTEVVSNLCKETLIKSCIVWC